MTAAVNGAGGRPLERVVAALERAGCRRGGPSSWTCPSHQDHNPSLSVRAADDGAVLVCCHAGCQTEDVVFDLGLQMADLFSGRDDPDGGEDWTPRGPAVASYRYTDEDGRLLYCVCRTADKQFPSWRPDPTSKTGKRWALTDKTGKWLVRRVLYRLPKVLEAAAAGSTVWVVEGEKDVHALEHAGVVATTNQGGASGPWLDAYTEALAGAQVVVVGDRDGPDPKHPRNSYKGQRRARHVARKLRSRAASVRTVMAAQGKDAADHLAAGLGTDDFVDLPAHDPPAEGQPSEQAPTDRDAGTTTRGRNGRGDGGEPERSTATELVALAEARYQLGTSSTGEPYAVARPGHGPHVARMLRGGQASLRAELAATFAQLHQRAPNSSALADALLVLEGRAMNIQPVEPALRVARHPGGLVLDLGDPTGQVVVLTPAGWELAERSPVLFRRTKATGTLPPPQPGGRLEELRERRLVNLTDASWPLALAWLVAALVPDIPHPIPLLCGEQGTGKSTTAKMLARLVDPSPAELRTGPKDLEQWAVAAAGSWLVVLDNISGVAPWLSDALCRAVTGDGLVRPHRAVRPGTPARPRRGAPAGTRLPPGMAAAARRAAGPCLQRASGAARDPGGRRAAHGRLRSRRGRHRPGAWHRRAWGLSGAVGADRRRRGRGRPGRRGGSKARRGRRHLAGHGRRAAGQADRRAGRAAPAPVLAGHPAGHDRRAHPRRAGAAPGRRAGGAGRSSGPRPPAGLVAVGRPGRPSPHQPPAAGARRRRQPPRPAR